MFPHHHKNVFEHCYPIVCWNTQAVITCSEVNSGNTRRMCDVAIVVSRRSSLTAMVNLLISFVTN